MSNYDEYANADPIFTIVRGALGDLVDGEHFFDVVADDISYEVRYELGWPRVIRGRSNLMEGFRGYVQLVKQHSADSMTVTRAEGGRILTLEYDIYGTIIATGARYENRFCSVVQIEGRKIVRWRDYMDSHAAWTALTAKA